MVELLLQHPEAHIQASVIVFDVILYLFVAIQSRREQREIESFRLLVICGVVITLTDIVTGWMLDSEPTKFHFYLINSVNMLNYLAIIVFAYGLYFYFLFIFKIPLAAWWRNINLVIFAAYSICLVANLYTGSISLYQFDVHAYVHGPLFLPIGEGVPIFVYSLSIISYAFNAKRLSYRYRRAIFVVILVLISGIVLQPLINPQVTVTGVFISLGLFILYLTVETEDFRLLIEANEVLEKAKKEAQLANEEKSLFLANMSHEIRTPLNAYLGLNEMILRESSDEKTLAYARDMKSAGNALLSVVNDVLDISKIETGDLEIEEKPYHFADLIGDIEVIITSRAKNKGLDFILDIDENLPEYFVGDAGKLQQVIINVLNNSVKYTERGVVILAVRGETVENAIQLQMQITDTGIGIRQKDLENLFESFQRVDMEKNKRIEGTGIGLSIVKMILDKMGGEIRIHSNYGMGTQTYIGLTQELYDPSSTYEQRRLQKTEVIIETDINIDVWQRSILIVDDNEMNLKVLEGLLSSTKAKVVSEPGGAEALAVLKKKKFDIVLTDAFMPVDGETVLYEVKSNPNHLNYETPFIVVTADALASSEEKYLAMGFDDYICKPIELQRLKEVLKKFLPDAVGYIDQNKAMDNFADEGLYKEVLKTFASSAEDKISHIKKALDEKSWKDYVIFVHALKSNANTIGAEELGNMAKDLEAVGKTLFDNSGSLKQEEILKEKTPNLLKLYEEVASEAQKRVL